MAASRPNILLITTDQQRFDTIHAAGNKSIWTPHLNYLCDTGIRYTRAYADSPVCGPSRATIMTGLHAHTHGHTSNNDRVSPMATVPTLPGLLAAGGYQTKAVGKMHFTPLRAKYGFEDAELLPDYYDWVSKVPGASPPKNHGIGENEMVPVFSTTKDEHSLTHWTVQRSIDFIETRTDPRPFFLWTSFTKPHPPWDAPREYWDIYDGIPMPAPVYGDWSQDPEQIPAELMGPTYCLNGVDRFSPQQLANARRAYYACISNVDYKLGLLFTRLRELNLLKNTWIIFTSDHGEMLGDHHMGAKSVFLEPSAHVPMLIRPPGEWNDEPRGGSTDDRLACLADLLPTILEIAGVTPPADLSIDGLSMLGEKQRDTLIGQCGPFHAVIEREWKYLFTEAGGSELLFNLADDPMEQRNRLNDPAAAPAQKRLKDKLIAALAKRVHAAAAGGTLQSTRPERSRAEMRRIAWPGFHSPKDHECDLLH